MRSPRLPIMIDLLALADRRDIPRLAHNNVRVTLRVPGQIGSCSGTLIDFNRHGLAVCLAGPSNILHPRRNRIAVSFRVDELAARNVNATIHNRTRIRTGLRLGIRFRLDEDGQFDSQQTRRLLQDIEDRLSLDALNPGHGEAPVLLQEASS